MIKCGNGRFSAEGSKKEIKADFATIVYALKNKDILSNDEIMEAVNDGFKSVEDMHEECFKLFTDILGKLL